MFWKKKNFGDLFVDLSIGRIYFYKLTNIMIINARIVGERKDGTLSNEAYISFIEKSLLPLSKKQYLSLTVKDGALIRDKVMELLKSHNLIVVEDVEQFSKEEQEWYAKQDERNKSIINNIPGRRTK